jgi:hypothetical protein
LDLQLFRVKSLLGKQVLTGVAEEES